VGHYARPTRNDTLDRKTAFRIVGQWFIRHLLLHLKTTGFFIGVIRDGFINISGHGSQQVVLIREELNLPEPSDQTEKI